MNKQEEGGWQKEYPEKDIIWAVSYFIIIKFEFT